MLALSGISVNIAGQSIIEQLSLSVSVGETLGLIGPNGSGKTTLFNCLSGYVLPRAGSILFRDTDVTNMNPTKRAALGIGRVFQNPGIFRDMTLIENVVIALEGRQATLRTFFPWSSMHRQNVARAKNYLDEIGLAGKAHEKAACLSGGQMRLLEIIRTLAFGAELFLLDEPTAGVSPKMKDEVASLIEKLRALKKTILIIEHDVNFIERFCNRIVVLNGGSIILDGPPADVRASPMLREVYFGNESSCSGNSTLTS